MSRTIDVVFAPQVALSALVSDEDFELYGIDTKTLSGEDYGISILDHSNHFIVIHGTPYQLQKFAASLMTLVRTIAHDSEDVNP